jgi:hypothetical protein
VDHERRLAQAIDALVEDFAGEAARLAEAAGYLPAPELADAGPEPPTPELAVVDAPELGPAPAAAPWRAVALPPLKEREQAVALEAPARPAAPVADSPQPAEPEPVSAPRPLTSGLGVAWTVLFALAVVLAVGSVVIALVGLLGGSI